jgi:hypothetical protein
MESEFHPDISPEYSDPHKIAAMELVRYCLEFDRWRKARLGSEALAQDLRRRGMLAPILAGRVAPPNGTQQTSDSHIDIHSQSLA